MKRLYVVGRPSNEPGETIQTRSEWAVWADGPKEAAFAYLNADKLVPENLGYEEGEVPDEWYDSEVPAEVTFVGEVEVYGPYGERP